MELGLGWNAEIRDKSNRKSTYLFNTPWTIYTKNNR